MEPPSCLQAKRATLTDLPSKLLLEIIPYLDNPTLIQFSLICKRTHQLGLETFFYRNNIRDPTDGELSLHDPPVETLPALRVALFVRRFHGISYFFASGAARTVWDVHHMACFFLRLSFGLQYARLVFSKDTRSHDLEADGIDGKSWFGRLARLLDAALEKGCRRLWLEGGEGMIDLYRQVAPEFQLDNGREGQESEVDPIHHNRLKKMWIYSDLFLSGPFYGWMLSTLRRTSSTLKTLAIHLRTVPTATWGSFMRSLHLPQLRDLELVNLSSDSADCSLSFIDLHFFLSRHCFIKYLVIHGQQAPPAASEPPKLPQLESIAAASGHLSWIIGSDQNPCLREVKNPQNLDTEHTFEDIDNIFEAILSFRGRITLNLCLPSEAGLEEWLLRPGVISSLTCVSTLDLSTPSRVHFTPGAFAALPGWLGLFPRLTYLKVYCLPQAEVEALKEPGMMRCLARTCKNLNTLETLGSTYDLGRFRGDGGEAVPADLPIIHEV